MTETLESLRAERDCARAQLQATKTALRNRETWLVPTERAPTEAGYYLTWYFTHWAMVEVASSSTASLMLQAWVDGAPYPIPNEVMRLWCGPIPTPPVPDHEIEA